MTTTIVLPDDLTKTLQIKAGKQQLSLNELVIFILSNALKDEIHDYPTIEDVTTKIKATPPNPANFHPATESLADFLRDVEDDPSFNEEAWNHDWARVEAEIKVINHADDLPPEMVDDMVVFTLLNDAALWRVAGSTLSSSNQKQLDLLLDKQKQDTLIETETAALNRLLHDYENIVLTRAQATVLLKQRGYDVSDPAIFNNPLEIL